MTISLKNLQLQISDKNKNIIMIKQSRNKDFYF